FFRLVLFFSPPLLSFFLSFFSRVLAFFIPLLLSAFVIDREQTGVGGGTIVGDGPNGPSGASGGAPPNVFVAKHYSQLFQGQHQGLPAAAFQQPSTERADHQ